MNRDQALHAFQALADERRLDAFRLLVSVEPDGLAARELARRLGTMAQPLTEELDELVAAGLVSAARQGRETCYRVRIESARALWNFLVEDCCSASPDLCLPGHDAERPRDARPFEKIWAAGRRFNVLFLCTHNSARSIMAEAIMNHDQAGRFRAWSAGSQPSGEVSEDTLALLERLGYPIEGLHSKSWDVFAGPEAAKMDFVFTVCDAAAGTCPVWPGAPMSAHWGVPDPRAVIGDATLRRLAHLEAFRMLERRIGVFASLPFAALERTALKKRLDQIGADTAARGNRA